MKSIDNDRPLYTITIGEFNDLLGQFYSNNTKSSQEHESQASSAHLVYGIRGIQSLFNCSHKSAQYYKDHVIQEAVSQNGRKIVVNADLAIQLFNEKRNSNVPNK